METSKRYQKRQAYSYTLFICCHSFLFLLLVQNTMIKTIDFINGRGYIYTAEPGFNIYTSKI